MEVPRSVASLVDHAVVRRLVRRRASIAGHDCSRGLEVGLAPF